MPCKLRAACVAGEGGRGLVGALRAPLLLTVAPHFTHSGYLRRCHNDHPVTVTIIDCTTVQKKEDDPESIVRFYNCEVRVPRAQAALIYAAA